MTRKKLDPGGQPCWTESREQSLTPVPPNKAEFWVQAFVRTRSSFSSEGGGCRSGLQVGKMWAGRGERAKGWAADAFAVTETERGQTGARKRREVAGFHESKAQRR